MSENATCTVCTTAFVPKFSFQAKRTATGTAFYCSQACHEQALFGSRKQACSTCTTSFEPKYAYQMTVIAGKQTYYCTPECRENPMREALRAVKGAKRIAVMNQKGGTGKTTTTVSLAHGLARAGYKTLIVDMDSQGNVAVCLGADGEQNLYHVMVDGLDPKQAIFKVRENLDLLPSNNLLAKVEVHLAHVHQPAKVMKNRFKEVDDYDYIILDCGPSLSLLNQNALYFADQVLIPVACDYLSLVGVKQILKTLREVQEQLRHPITILGVLPTFYDVRNRISHEVIRNLERYFKDKVMHPIRINTRLKEAPSKHKSIFEFAPKSAAAQDYQILVERVVAAERSKPSQAMPQAYVPSA
ncbi:MAG: chromosome partitioning protein [Myxococcota bacterium]|jgi:chromosome partitioning protein